MAKANGAAKEPQFNTETLRADIRDHVLTEFKLMPKPWQQMTEDEQDQIINRAEDIATTLVNAAVDLIAARGLPSLPITVGKFTVEGAEMKGVFTSYADDENLLRIRHLADRRAVFVLADPSDYAGDKDRPEPEVVGDLAMPKTGQGSPSDEAALAQVGRG